MLRVPFRTAFVPFAIVLCFSAHTFAQQTAEKRQVLYTLESKEILYNREYSAYFQAGKNVFMAILEDTVTDKYNLLFNGQKYPCVGYPNVFYTNLAENTGFAFSYVSNGLAYVNAKGRTYGPYDRVSGYITNDYQPAFMYIQKGKNYLWENGIVSGPYADFVPIKGHEGWFSWSKSYHYAGFFPDYSERGRFFFNKKEVGQFREYATIYANDAGYMVHDYESGKGFININGSRVSLPDGYFDNIVQTKAGNSYSLYKNDQKEGMELYKNVVLIDQDVSKFSVSYNTEMICYLKDGNIIVNGKNIDYQPDEGYKVSDVAINDAGELLVAEVNENEKQSVLKFKGAVLDVVDAVHIIDFTENNEIFISYEKNHIWQFRQGERIHTRFTLLRDYLYSGGYNTLKTGHSFINDYNRDYVTIDGTPYGNSPAIDYWYDEAANSFYWISLESKELVFYSLKVN